MCHSVPGRVRLRVPEAYADDGPRMAERLRHASGVWSVRWTRASSSLVVAFEPSLTFAQVLEHVPATTLPHRRAATAPEPSAPWWRQFLPAAVSLVAGLAGIAPLSTIAIAACAAPIGRRAIKGLWGRKLTIDVLDAGAVSILLGSGDMLAAGASVALIESGERLRRQASGRARRVFRQWLGADERGVRLLRHGTEPRVPLESVALGDHAVVYAGERIPVDGVIVSGSGSVDNRTWTGEPYPVVVEPGDTVLAGATVLDGRLVCEITATGEDTRAGQLAAAIEDALAANTPTTDMARRIADRFVGPVLLAGGAVFLLTGDLGRLAAMLIVDFGTGIRVAVPTAFLTTMIAGGREQILFKNGGAIEALASVDTIVFDKTGTLTRGRPEVIAVEATAGFDADSVLRLAAAAEGHLPHPLARAIRRYARTRGLELPEPDGIHVAPGGGVSAMVEGRSVKVGRRSFLEREGVVLPAAQVHEQSIALIAVDGVNAGVVRMHDRVRGEAQAVFAALRKLGVSRLVLATGDREGAARRVARDLGVDAVHAQLMPEDKVRLVRALRAEGARVAVVGDGINDASALAEASVGVAVARGADLARETADVVLAAEDLSLLVDAVRRARFAMHLVRENIGLVAAPNAVALGAATLGALPPLAATVVNNGTTLLAGANSLRPLRHRREDLPG